MLRAGKEGRMELSVREINLCKPLKRLKTILSVIYFLLISISSPLWIGCIYMWITGHGKGYGYDLGSEAEISVFLGAIFLLLWLIVVLPVTVSLCRKCRRKKKAFTWLPLLAFILDRLPWAKQNPEL